MRRATRRSNTTVPLLAALTLGAVTLAGAGCDRRDLGSGGTAQQADNTGRNERDRDGTTKTPLDQGNSESDTELTAKIRKDVVDAKLSTNASNVKIITAAGHVTLRGPVDSESERDRIAEIAMRHAGATNVTNQIEVVAK
jgi:hyperosmotically inducible protein